MSGVSIRARLTLGYLIVLGAAALLFAVGARWLFQSSVRQAADTSLADRVEGTRRFISAAQHELPPEELSDEFQEFADLTRGETLLQVVEAGGRILCHPALPGWDTLHVPSSPSSDLHVAERDIAGHPYRAIATSLEVDGHVYQLTAAFPMSAPYAALRRFTVLMAILMPAVLLLAGAGGLWLSGRALGPVDRMTRDVQQISLSDPSRRLDVPPAGDELSRLAETFNGMLARWQGAFANVARLTADASHELRTPVSLARTTAELALSRPRTSDEYRTALSEVLALTERMSLLVGDLLTLARSDAGVELPQRTPVDIGAIVSEVVRDVTVAADRKSLRLHVQVPPDAIAVQGLRESLRRLLVIVLDNAVAYTPAGGTVHVRVTSEPSRGTASSVRIEITDSGVGIPEDDRVRVFDRFYRGMAARDLAPDGAGLGLAIAKTIVDSHRGRIAADAAPAGGGSRITIVLPAGAAL